MYKEIVVCFIIIVLIFSLNYISGKFLDNTVDEMNSKMNNLKTSIEEIKKNEDENKDNNMKDKLGEVTKYWSDKYKILNLYLEHDEIEKVTIQLALIEAHIDEEMYDDAIVEIERGKFSLKHLKSKQKLTWDNIA